MKPWLKKTDENEIEVLGSKIVLKKISFGASRSAVNASVKIDPKTQKTDVDATLLSVLRTIGQIKDWDLTDENDEKLPINLNTFDEVLDEEYASKIIEAVQKHTEPGVTEKEKKK